MAELTQQRPTEGCTEVCVDTFAIGLADLLLPVCVAGVLFAVPVMQLLVARSVRRIAPPENESA